MPESPSFSYSMRSEYLGNKGFNKSIVFFKISFIYEACDYPIADVLIATDLKNKKIYYVLEAPKSSSETGSVFSSIVFPKDINGKSNQIKLIIDIEYTNDKGEIVKEKKTEIYKFDG